MPRPPRTDEAGGLYYALNRGNLRADIFRKEADFAAFKRILHEGLQIYRIELFSYQLMSNHYHLELRPSIDGEMHRFMGWIGGTHTKRYSAHYHTSGLGPVYQHNSDTTAFRSRTTTTSLSFAATLSETPCARRWWIALRIGVGDDCDDGNRSPSLIQSCCRRGRFPDCRNGWHGLTIRSQRRNWTQFACPLSEAVHWEMLTGWNQSPHASTSSQPYVRADGNNCDQKSMCQSKTPDPFDLSHAAIKDGRCAYAL